MDEYYILYIFKHTFYKNLVGSMNIWWHENVLLLWDYEWKNYYIFKEIQLSLSKIII